MSAIASNLQAVRQRIETAAASSGRDPAGIRLLAVSKTWPAECLLEAIAAGQTVFGENYVQEAVEKIAALRPARLEWHFIGPLQSNKTRLVAENFDWVHTIDRLKIAERLAAQRPSALPELQVCVQVNISGEASKHGCTPAETADLCRQLARLPGLKLRGLMAIPAASDNITEQRRQCARLHGLFERLRADGLPVDTLSMGMSHDLEAAIAEGATLVRIGTAIFGERNAT